MIFVNDADYAFISIWATNNINESLIGHMTINQRKMPESPAGSWKRDSQPKKITYPLHLGGLSPPHLASSLQATQWEQSGFSLTEFLCAV